MIGKNNYYLKNTKEGTKVESYSIKKFKVGAASVVIGASIFFGAGAVAQASESVSNNTATDESLGTDNKLEVAPKAQVKPVAENTRDSAAAAVALKLENSEKETLNKTALTKLIEEIDGKFTNGKYASKTEDSVKLLKAALEEARTVLNNAKTQAELSQAHAKLVTATTKLKTKPKDEKQPPAGDTTNGKPTVGLQATNTEKASESNSIANSGARDKRHGKALNRSNLFRADAGTTDTDPAAHQTYTLPGDNASVAELAKSLNGLNSSISNETKLASIDEVGALKNVQAGEVEEIDEFGGWSAVSADGKKGKFAIARKTNEGVFPIETVNTTRTGADDYRKYIIHVEENAFDRSHEYALFLSKVRTNATNNEETFDGNPFKDIGEGREIAKGLKGFNGIEKTYKAYSSSTGTGVNISFKTGFTGDIDGKKAGYKVEVIAKFEDGHTQSIYNQSFRPDQSINNANMVVSKVDANDSVKFEVKSSPEPTTTALNQKLATYKNRQVNRTGSFTSKNIELPKGAIEYTVRISASDNDRLGMGYQTTWAHYALPVSGLGFTITQDTNRVARTLLERVYNKLLDTRDADMRGKTPESQKAYQDQLNAIKALLDGELKSTDEYKRLVQPTLTAHEALKVDKSALTTSKESLDDLVNDDPTPGKTPATVNVYNNALNAAKAEVNKANTIIADESATVDQVAQAVADVKAAKAELRAARAELVVAATDAQKTKLQNDSDALKEADKTGKTPKSIKEYEDKYRELEAAVTAAKAQAKTVLDKTENAGKVEATDAQTEVDKIKAELEKAAALLKEKGNTAELENAKNALKTLTQETNVTTGKTKETSDKYEAAKTAAEAAVTAAETVIGDINSTPEQVAEALTNVRAKKAELEKAKAALVDKATTEQKTKLDEAAAKLVKASTDGKTQDSVNAYETAYTNLTAELEAAKAKATAIKTAGDNASRLEALAAQEAVDAVQAKLEAAKATLVDKATDDQVAELRKADAALTPAEGSTFEATKTPTSIAAYKNAVDAIQSQLTEAKTTAADLVTKAGQNNATRAEAAAAITKVEALKAKLVDATALLKDKANTGDLTTAKDELKALAGVANVTDGKTTSTKEAYDAAKQAADAAVTAAEGIINNADSTPEQVATALANVNTKKAALEAAKTALLDKITQDQKDDLSNAEESLKLADTTGKTKDSIKAYNDEVAKLNDELAAAKQAAKDLVAKGDNAGELEAYRVQAKINKLKSKLAEAAKLLKDIDKSAAKKEVEDAAKKATDAIVANNDLTPEQKEAAKAKVAEEATKAIDAIDKATTEDAVTTATDAGKLGIEKEAAKAVIEAAKAAKGKAIEANAELTPEQKAAAKAKVADEATKATDAIDKATTKDGVTTATDAGKLGIEKEAAKAEIEAAKAAKEKAIEANTDLTPEQKAAAKAKVAEEATKATAAIDKATTKDGVTSATDAGKLGIEKEAAKAEIEAAKAAKEKAIEANAELTPEQKAAAKAKVAEEATKATDAIDKATTKDVVTKATDAGKLGIEKEAAKAEIEAAKAAKEKAIEANAELTPEQKAAAKAKVAEEATKATDAIDKATTKDGVTSATDAGKLGIEKEAEKAEIEAAKVAKEKAIDARTDLTDDEKAKAKAKVAEEAKKAIEAIENAKTHNDASAKTETGKDDIKKINPTGGKEIAKKAIDEALAAKEKAIDARTDLLPKEKEAAKKAAREEAEAAKNAIDKAATSEDINKVLEDGKENIAKINPIGAKEEAKKAVEEALANKEKEIDARTDLTSEEKVKEKELAREEAKAAKDAIDKATSIEAIEKALRPFLYQIDQDALVFDLPTFDFEKALKSLVQGTVSIELGSDISDQDILSKLDLPEGLEVVKIEKPTTTILGATSAKVTIKLSDGSYATVEVPVEVVKNNSKGSEDNRRPENKVHVDKTTENTNREENRSSVSKENSKVSKNMLPNTGTTETNTGLAGLGLGILGGLLAAARRRKEK